MKVKRSKTSKRIMSTFLHGFGFREPYQVLVDGNMVVDALKTKSDLKTQIPNVLAGKAKLMTSTCVVEALRAQGSDMMGAVVACKRFERRRCPHSTPIPPDECLASIIGDHNKFHYCVATQDKALRVKLRHVGGVPLIYMRKGVLILEPASEATLAKSREREIAKTKLRPSEVLALKGAVPSTAAPTPKKKKKSKNPNPLSCMKKKRAPSDIKSPVSVVSNHQAKPVASKESSDSIPTIKKSGRKRKRRRVNESSPSESQG